MRILHVTESMGGGIVTLLDSLSRKQDAEGAEVELLFSVRPDTPSEDMLRTRFSSQVKLHRIKLMRFSQTLFVMFRRLRTYYKDNTYDAVHLHSSFAGAIGRLARIGVKTESGIYYSPHGFAFLRLNTSAVERFLNLLAERILQKYCDQIICTSPSEAHLARKQLKANNVTVLQTGVPTNSIALKLRRVDSRQLPVVGMIGRATYQKAPWRFAAVARSLKDCADFMWIGASKERDKEGWFQASPVKLIPWLSTSDLEKTLETIDILLFPSLWEGMSLSLIQAQAAGIPAVVSDCVGNRDAVLHGKTGYVCHTDDELLDFTRLLIKDSTLRKRMSVAALAWARENLTDDNIGVDSMTLYAAKVR